MGQLINQGKVNFVEIPINKMPRLVQRGVFGKIDVAIVEALAITKEGYIVPSTSVGLVPHLVAQAEQVIVELNVAQPIELEGIHDIYIPCLPPNKKPIPLYRTNQRIGEPFIRVNPEKITYIVKSDVPDQAVKFTEDQASMQKISDNLLNFLEIEVNQRLGGWLPPIQSGMGNMANNIVAAFKKAKFDNLDFFCGILQEANIELISMGKVRAASGVAFTPSTKALRLIRDNPDLSVAAKQGTL